MSITGEDGNTPEPREVALRASVARGDVRALVKLATYLADRQRYLEAGPFFDGAVAVNPSPGVITKAARCWETAEKPNEAEKYYRLVPGEFGGHWDYACFLRRQGRFREAAQQFEKDFRASDFSTALWSAVDVSVMAGDIDHALTLAKEGIARPDAPEIETVGRLGSELLNAGRDAETALLYASCGLHGAAGRIAFRLRDMELAERELRLADAGGNAGGEELFALGSLLAQSGRAPEALDFFQRSVDADSMKLQSLARATPTGLTAGMLEPILRSAVANGTNSATSTFATWLKKHHRLAEAAEVLVGAYESDPSYLRDAVHMLADSGAIERAESLARDGVASGHSGSVELLGTFLLSQGRPGDAAIVYLDAARASGYRAHLRDAADAFERAGNDIGARSVYLRAAHVLGGESLCSEYDSLLGRVGGGPDELRHFVAIQPAARAEMTRDDHMLPGELSH